MFNFDDWTELENESVFRFDPLPVKSYEKADQSVQMDITFERDLSLLVISRDGYTVLDWISDIGGIQSILMGAVAIIVGYWNYNNFDNFLVSALYMLDRD